MGVLGQKTVTGMNRIDVANLRRAHDAIDLQITLAARRRADADGFISELDMERVDIGFGINGERVNTQLFAGTDHAQRNFATIRDQDFLKHGSSASVSLAIMKNASGKLALPYSKKHLTELHRFAILGHDFGDDSAGFGFDLVHHFHRLDNADHRVFAHVFSNVDKWRGVG